MGQPYKPFPDWMRLVLAIVEAIVGVLSGLAEGGGGLASGHGGPQKTSGDGMGGRLPENAVDSGKDGSSQRKGTST